LSSSTVSKISGLIGLQGAKRALLRFMRPDSGVHAVLLYGTQGAGKKTLANALAQAWLCTNVSDEGACGECRSCDAFVRQRSADLLRIHPLGPSDLIKAGAITETDNPDDDKLLPALDFLRTPPLMARHKVVTIFRADRMNQTAANAFLKTLEEPQTYAKIVMTSAEIGRVLPTIVSRCVCVACELPERGELDTMGAGMNALLRPLADGAPGRLNHLHSNEAAYRPIAEFAASLPAALPIHALALSEKFRDLCDELGEALKMNARAGNCEGLRALGSACSANECPDDWLTAIVEAHRRIQGNAAPGSTFDTMFARMLLG
jgi:hypothetical protein